MRIDFDRAPTHLGRIVLIGEAAGLVNPVTGEGIDYALETGKLAAEHLVGLFVSGDVTHPDFRAYDRDLRQRYQQVFALYNRLRVVYHNRLMVNLVVHMMAQRPEVRQQCMRILFEHADVWQALTPRTLCKVVFG